MNMRSAFFVFVNFLLCVKSPFRTRILKFAIAIDFLFYSIMSQFYSSNILSSVYV